MAWGDGIRRDIAHVSEAERNRFIHANKRDEANVTRLT